MDVVLTFDDGLLYQILSETVYLPIEKDYTFISTIRKVAIGDGFRSGKGSLI